MRAERLLTALTLILAVTVVAASASANLAQPAVAQASDDVEPPAPAPALLDLGHRFSGPGWELEIQDAFVVESEFRTDWSEVRVAAVFSTTLSQTPYLISAFTGDPGYPELVLVDEAGEDRPLPATDPESNLVAGSTLLSLPPQVPARWTIGYEVPSAFVSELRLEARWDGVTHASWDLLSTPDDPAPWPIPDGLVQTEFGEPIPWSEDLEVTATEHAVLVCGNPDTELVTATYGMLVDIANSGTHDLPFPDVQYPDLAGVAVWDDGASARYAVQTAALPVDLDTGEVLLDMVTFLREESIERAMIPPESTHELFLLFNVPRDGRFVDVDKVPAGVILYPANDEPVWVTAATEPNSEDLLLSCDDVVGSHRFEFDQDGPIDPILPTTTTTTVAADTTTTTTTSSSTTTTTP